MRYVRVLGSELPHPLMIQNFFEFDSFRRIADEDSRNEVLELI